MYEQHEKAVAALAEKIPSLAYAEVLQCQVSKKWFVEINGLTTDDRQLIVVSSSDDHMEAVEAALKKWDLFEEATQEEEYEFGKLRDENASLRTG